MKFLVEIFYNKLIYQEIKMKKNIDKNTIEGQILAERSERIAKIRSFYFKNHYDDFASKLEVSVKYASGLCNQKEVITEKTLEKILKVFPEVSRKWLFFGEGEMFSNGNITNNAGDIIQGQTVEVSKTRDELLQSQQRTIELLTNQANKFQEQIDRFLSMLEKCLEQDNKLHDK